MAFFPKRWTKPTNVAVTEIMSFSQVSLEHQQYLVARTSVNFKTELFPKLPPLGILVPHHEKTVGRGRLLLLSIIKSLVSVRKCRIVAGKQNI